MKQHLYTKLLILYFMLGGICFLLLSSGGSYLVEKRLERSTGESLYRTASQLVSKNELRQAVKSPKNESLTLALSSAAAFQNADFWVMDTDGNVLINTNQQSSDSGDITVRNFRPEDYEDTCYSSGTFYGTLKTTQLSTVVPIKDTDLVTGYLVIHYPMKNLYESRSNIVEVMILIFIVIYALFFSFLLIYFYRVHKPLKEILKGALEFANGNLTYTIPVDSEDEMGYLSHSLNYMADKLNKNGEYQRQFISNVSHDFRSPLTSIKGYVEAILDGTIPEKEIRRMIAESYDLVTDSPTKRIYEAVKQIPKGHVATYGQVAAMAGEPKMARAVGNALHKNPDPEHIPCYRVVNSKGELAGAFAFGGENVQKKLLEADGIEVINGKVDLKKYGL